MVRKKQNAPVHLGESLQSAYNEAHHGARPGAASGREGSNLRPMLPPTAATVSVPNLPADQLHAFYRANLQPHAGGAEAGKRISTSADAGSIAVTAEARGCGVDARSAPAAGRSGVEGATEAGSASAEMADEAEMADHPGILGSAAVRMSWVPFHGDPPQVGRLIIVVYAPRGPSCIPLAKA